MSNEKERMFKVLKDAGLMEHYHETVENIREDAMIEGSKMDLRDVFDLLFSKALREKYTKDQNKIEVQVSRILIDGVYGEPKIDNGFYPYLPYVDIYSDPQKVVYMMDFETYKKLKNAQKEPGKSPHITQEERTNFHAILDQAIDKMNRPKNAQKPHWTEQERDELLSLLKIEVRELSHAMKFKSLDDQNEELYDVINYAMMMADINTRIKDE